MGGEQRKREGGRGRILPNLISGAISDPWWNWPVLLQLLSQFHLNTERLVGSLKAKGQINLICNNKIKQQ